MLKLYWRIVFQPYFWLVVLISVATFVSSLAEVASIGMIIPVAGLMIEPEASATNPMNVVLSQLGNFLGMEPDQKSWVLIAMGVVALLVVIKNVLVVAKTRWVNILLHTVARVTRLGLFEAYLRAQYSEITSRGRGVMYEDIDKASNGVGNAIFVGVQLLTSVTYVITALGLLFYISWWMTLLVGGVVLLSGRYLSTLLEDRSKRIARRVYELGQRQTAQLVDALDGIRVVKTHTFETSAVTRVDAIQSELMPLHVRAMMLRDVPAVFFEVAGIMLVVLMVGGTFTFPIIDLTLPQLMAMVVGMRRLLPALSGVNTTLVQLSGSLRHIEIVDEVLNEVPAEQSGSTSVSQSGVEKVQLEQVSFHYSEHTDARVLHDMELTFRRGQVTALVGHTGSGKTTIADLLVRLYDPISGQVLVDGVDLRELDLAAWRQSIGYVGQDTFLFNTTLRDNIVLWNESVSQAAVKQTAQAAQLDEFVQSLPDGYDTVIGDRGMKLSGGQRQRVSIARAILHKPEILIFDEATSALDSITERAVFAAISRMRVDAIVIVIAHRMSTVQGADNIIVLENGCVVEQGKHDDLMSVRGHYWGLHEGLARELESTSYAIDTL